MKGASEYLSMVQSVRTVADVRQETYGDFLRETADIADALNKQFSATEQNHNPALLDYLEWIELSSVRGSDGMNRIKISAFEDDKDKIWFSGADITYPQNGYDKKETYHPSSLTFELALNIRTLLTYVPDPQQKMTLDTSEVTADMQRLQQSVKNLIDYKLIGGIVAGYGDPFEPEDEYGFYNTLSEDIENIIPDLTKLDQTLQVNHTPTTTLETESALNPSNI